MDWGDWEKAEGLIAEMDAISEPAPGYLAAMMVPTRVRIALRDRLPDEAERLLDEADAFYRAEGIAAGRVFVDLSRATARLSQEDAPGALAILDGSAHDAVLKARPELGMSWLATRLLVHCATDDRAAIEGPLAEFESRRTRHPSTSRDLQVYKALASQRVRAGDTAGGVAAYERVLGAIEETLRGWGNAEDRSRFLKTQEETFESARVLFGSEGKEAEFDDILRRITEPPDPCGGDQSRAGPEAPSRGDPFDAGQSRGWGRVGMSRGECGH